MPLDPFFAERLRIHRRYLMRRLLSNAGQRLRAWVDAGLGRYTAPTTSPTVTSTNNPARSQLGPRAAARQRHRRAALAWDRTELEQVGTPGPPMPTRECEVPVAGWPAVKVRVYDPRPEGAAPGPAVLTFFGGAFRIGGIDYPTTDAACRRRAAAADVVMVAVDYALAPENQYPTQIEQAHAVLEWLVDRAVEIGIDPTRIAVAGTSAGAAIAAAVTLMNRDRGSLPLRLQVLEVPVLDLTGRHLDLRATWAMGIPSIVAIREMLSVARTYLPSSAAAREAYASPLRAESVRDLPPALILTAEYDPLRRDGAAYGARLRAAGVEATVAHYPGMTHDVPIFTGALRTARVWEAQIVAAFRTLHE